MRNYLVEDWCDWLKENGADLKAQSAFRLFGLANPSLDVMTVHTDVWGTMTVLVVRCLVPAAITPQGEPGELEVRIPVPK